MLPLKKHLHSLDKAECAVFQKSLMQKFWLVGLLSSALLLAGCSLADDITPPPGFTTPVVTKPPAAVVSPTPVNTVGQSPAFKPSAADGVFIFTENCAPCHGVLGKADGERSEQLRAQHPEPLPDFSTYTLTRQTTPSAWFATITDGRIEKLMPPWRDALSEAERWSAVAYLYTLSTPPEQIAQGQALYADNCAECHGPEGQGDGPQASELKEAPRDLSDLSWTADRSQQDFFNAVSEGVASGTDASASMPAFADLTEAERWAVVDYVRTFSYEYLAPGTAPDERLGTVVGQVVNGSAGGPVPTTAEVFLHSFDDANFTTFTSTIDAQGYFTFTEVPYIPGRRFITTVDHQAQSYLSEVSSFGVGQKTLVLPITIYDTTGDPTGVRVQQVHAFLDFSTPGSVTVGQLFIFANNGDKTYLDANGLGLQFALPTGATNLQVEEGTLGQTYTTTATGFADMRGVPPGESVAQILFSFDLPYQDGLQFSQPMVYPVDNINLLVSDLAVKVAGPTLQALGVESMQGVSFQNFSQPPLQAGQTFVFTLSGAPDPAAQAADTATPALATGNTTELAIGLGVLALVLIGGGVWWYRRSQTQTGKPVAKDDLLQALAELDDAYAAGQVAEPEYQQERAWLKEQLKKVWE